MAPRVYKDGAYSSTLSSPHNTSFFSHHTFFSPVPSASYASATLVAMAPSKIDYLAYGANISRLTVPQLQSILLKHNVPIGSARLKDDYVVLLETFAARARRDAGNPDIQHLHPSFDPARANKAQLQSILSQNGFSYPRNCVHGALVDRFNECKEQILLSADQSEVDAAAAALGGQSAKSVRGSSPLKATEVHAIVEDTGANSTHIKKAPTSRLLAKAKGDAGSTLVPSSAVIIAAPSPSTTAQPTTLVPDVVVPDHLKAAWERFQSQIILASFFFTQGKGTQALVHADNIVTIIKESSGLDITSAASHNDTASTNPGNPAKANHHSHALDACADKLFNISIHTNGDATETGNE